MSSSRPDTAATKRDVDSEENIGKFICAREATTSDNLLLDGSISNADVRMSIQVSTLVDIIRMSILTSLSYLLTCDPPADVNGRDRFSGYTPMWLAADYNNTSAVKVLIDFGGDRTIKVNSNIGYESNMTFLDIAKKNNNQGPIKLLMECF